MQLFQRRTMVVLLSIVMIGVSSLVTPNTGEAAYTPNQCDATPKYWCTSIEYSISGSTYTVHQRMWQGAVDGGAKKWRLLYADDYYGQYQQPWTLDRQYGPTAWLSNQFLGSWYCGCGDNPLPGGAMVKMRLEYEECVPVYPGGPNECRPWYSDIMRHYAT